jgi:hypothetical protein
MVWLLLMSEIAAKRLSGLLCRDECFALGGACRSPPHDLAQGVKVNVHTTTLRPRLDLVDSAERDRQQMGIWIIWRLLGKRCLDHEQRALPGVDARANPVELWL